MTWWWRTVRAAWDRWDEWLRERDAQYDADPQVVAIRRINRGKGSGVEDTGSIVATPEDLAEIGVVDPVTRPGRRHQGRHASPKDFEETT